MTTRFSALILAVSLFLVLTLVLVPGCENKVTQETYDAIQMGMTQSQVEDLLGGSGEEENIGGVSIGAEGLMSSAKKGPQKTFVWKKDGGMISVTFRDGKVVDKGRMGL